MTELTALKKEIRDFVARRDWSQFHSPKNLSMALLVEAAELMERFQWLTESESSALSAKNRSAVAEELADVLIYLLLLADKFDIDIVNASHKKIAKNRRKYPVSLARGRADKSRDLKRHGRRRS